MYMLDEQRDGFVDRLLELWNKNNMLVFTMTANDLYASYGEDTADEVMMLFKKKLQTEIYGG